MSYKPSNANGQATMANSEPVVIASNQSAIPVTGTFWQATQPVSIASMPSTPVTGTFWQATQPVSIASMPSTPVTGTFWQATQPVSLASVPSHAVTNAGTFAVQAAQSGTWNIGTLTNLSQLGGVAISMNTGVRDTGTQRVTIATNDVVPVSGPLTDTQLRATAVPVSLASVPSHAVTLASTTITGTVAVTDNAGSLTIDAPVGTPAFVRLSDGTSAITTLPVSLASVPSHAVTNAGTFAVQVTSAPTTSVTGTFWQTTQPVSIASMPSTPVTGTFWQATQPVSLASTTITGSVAVTDNAGSITVDAPVGTPAFVRLSDGTSAITTLPVSLASVPTHGVTGTFWQATQPVSIASMPSTPVTGTFWQTTQPVSGTVSANATLSAETTKVIGTVNIAAAQTLATVTTVGAVTSITNALPAGTNAIGKLAANAAVVIGAVELAPATTNTTSNSTTTAYAASLIVKASAGTLFNITGYNSSASAQFIQVHDSATLPADTTVPVTIFRVPPGSNFSFDLTPFGRSFTAGITICNSSTGPTKTIGAADCWIDAQYK